MVISDIVQERPLDMDDDCGCVSTAMLRADYLRTIQDAGFVGLELVEDTPAVRSAQRVDASAITLKAIKPQVET